MASTGVRVYHGSPQRGSGAEPLIEASRGKALLKLKAFEHLDL